MTFEPKVGILFLNKDEVEGLINVTDAVEAAEQAYRSLGEGQIHQYHLVMPIKGQNTLNTMPTYIKDLDIYGMKQINVYNKREQGDDLPRIWGSLIILTNPVDALPYTIMDGTFIHHMRTGGGHPVVAAKYLAKKGSRTLAIYGCNNEAEIGYRSFNNNFPLEKVKLYDSNAEAMLSVKERIQKDSGVEIIASDSPQEAAEGADIILITTSLEDTILQSSWVNKGCFIAGLRAFRDIDPELSKNADKWVVGTLEGDGELIDKNHVLFPKGIDKKDIYGDMGEIVTGAKLGRENDGEIIVYTHMGMGGHDVLLAHKAYTRAIEKGKGIKIYL